MTAVIVRPSVDADLPTITAIYEYFVRHGVASFEEIPPTLEQMAERRARVFGERMPYLVAELDGWVVGYAYATIYRTRAAYRFTAEDSIYVDHAHGRAGIGSALLGALIKACESNGCRQMVAVISDQDGGSVRLHERFGFTPAGTLKSVGFKFGRWIDTLRMQRALGGGDSSLPADAR